MEVKVVKLGHGQTVKIKTTDTIIGYYPVTDGFIVMIGPKGKAPR